MVSLVFVFPTVSRKALNVYGLQGVIPIHRIAGETLAPFARNQVVTSLPKLFDTLTKTFTAREINTRIQRGVTETRELCNKIYLVTMTD